MRQIHPSEVQGWGQVQTVTELTLQLDHSVGPDKRELAQLPVVAYDVFAAFFLPLNQLTISQIVQSSILPLTIFQPAGQCGYIDG